VDSHQKARSFYLGIFGLSKCDSLREMRSARVGQLFAVSGTVTRTSEVRPELVVGVFQCTKCGTLSAEVEQEFKYTQPQNCPRCITGDGGSWELRMDQSRFVDWQKARVQENATEVPAGSMPRSIEVILRNEVVERAKPGDQCVFTGTLIVVPDVSKLRAPGERVQLRRGIGRGADENLEGALGGGLLLAGV
jgi:DNA replication licensing factor MCM6